MAEKKVTIKEFNKDFFNDWTKITKITPHFVDWIPTGYEDEEDMQQRETVIEKIDIEFDDGKKLCIFPYSNKDEMDEEISNALRIVQYKGEEVNWRKPKD